MDDDFTITLDDAGVRELESVYGITKAEAPAKAAVPKAEAKAPTKVVDEPPVKAADNDLLRRVREAEERAATERAKRIEAERLAHERGTTVAVTTARAAESDFHAVSNALNKATAESEALKVAHRQALESGDYAAAAETADKMAEAKATIIQLRDGKAALEDRVRTSREKAEVASKSEPPRSEPPSDPMDKFFASTNMPAKAQAWFRAHPEAAPHNDRAAYYKALATHETIMKQGVEDGSDEYYQRLDQLMGYADVIEKDDGGDAGDGGDDVEVVAKPAPKPAQKRVAAPVARDSSVLQRRADGKMQLRLSPEQAKFADEIGMSRTSYAKHLLKAEQEGKLGGHNLG